MVLMKRSFVFRTLITLTLCCYSSPSCVYDKVQSTNIPKKVIKYHVSIMEETAKPTLPPLMRRIQIQPPGSAGRKRRAVSSLYQPLRIHIHYSNIDYELNSDEQKKLKSVISSAVDTMTKILSVVPVQGKLRLGRSGDSCKSKWGSGINKDKCGIVDLYYKGEFCVKEFMIPEEHLEPLYQYSATDPVPVEIRKGGEGINNTDYILYIMAKTTTNCTQLGVNVVAYAAYCQLDQTSRPVAGFINICPSYVRDPSKSLDKLKLTALHELIHALGFSKDLFHKFQECQPDATGSSVQCSPQPSTVNTVYGVQRLVTPALVKMASDHYGCVTHNTINEFGPVLETEGGYVKSHWDAAFLQGSLMASRIDQPHLTVLDNFTLALFEDTGWYKVNYQYAEPYIWGKGEGCYFGLNGHCENSSDYFCSTVASGCHYLHYDKGECSDDVTLHGCKIYTPANQGNCQTVSNAPNAVMLDMFGECFTIESRCFVSSLVKQSTQAVPSLTGRCYKHRCDSQQRLSIMVGVSDWILCPYGQSVKVPGYDGFVQCPLEGVLCQASDTTYPPTTTPTNKMTGSSVTPGADVDVVCLEIIFPSADYEKLQQQMNLNSFRNAVITRILSACTINKNRLQKIDLKAGSIHFLFDLLPPFSRYGVPTSQVYSDLQRVISAGGFTVQVAGVTYVASQIKYQNEAEAPQLTTGAIIGIIAACICVIIIICAVSYLLVHHLSTTRVIPTPEAELRSSSAGSQRPVQTPVSQFTGSSMRGSSAASRSQRTSVSGTSTISGIIINGHMIVPPNASWVESEDDRISAVSARQIQLKDNINV